jgi:thiamine biosynthesis lipoprotein
MRLNGSKWPRIGLLVCSLCVCGMARAEWVRATDTAMTTRIELEFWAENDAQRAGLKDDVLAVFHGVDRDMSRYKPSSELSRVNRQAAEQPVAVSDPLFEVFSRALDISRLSQGAFDISFASVGYLYDYRAGIQPDGRALDTGLSLVDYRAIVLDAEKKTVSYRKPGVVSDLGGIAKGYAVDLGMEVLRQAGVRHARLSAGGDMRLLGDKRGKPWVVGIRDPRSKNENAVLLPLNDVSVSTSGDYERFFIDEEGRRVHHILSPATGRPAEGVQSVTVVGPDTLTTDGLSTAVFVLGVEEGLAMINRLPDIDAIIIDDERVMHYSDGLAPGQ